MRPRGAQVAPCDQVRHFWRADGISIRYRVIVKRKNPFFGKFCALYFLQKGAVMLNAREQLVALDRGTILTKAAVRAAERLDISGRLLAHVLGVSEAQVSRFRSGEAALADHSKPFELAALLVRAFRSLDAITGGDEGVARAWLIAPNAALGARPSERIASAQGLVDVVTYLDARRAPL